MVEDFPSQTHGEVLVLKDFTIIFQKMIQPASVLIKLHFLFCLSQIVTVSHLLHFCHDYMYVVFPVNICYEYDFTFMYNGTNLSTFFTQCLNDVPCFNTLLLGPDGLKMLTFDNLSPCMFILFSSISSSWAF